MRRILVLLALATIVPLLQAAETHTLTGRIADAQTDEPLPARVYLHADDGSFYFAKSAAEQGSSLKYDVSRSPTSVEQHVTLSAHPFSAELPPGQYTITAERGKEYLPTTKQVEVGTQDVMTQLRLQRWINMAERGWYSGDTHVHRPLAELPNVVMAEDLNVALPLSFWVRDSYSKPLREDESPLVESGLISVDETHVIYPMNTEYELFTVNGKRHTQGAVFVLNHKSPLHSPAPPVLPVAQEAREQGAILDLDKHSWAWSLMIVPLMDVDLFELSNNHIWRTEFFFKDWTVNHVPESFEIERAADGGLTEWGWTDFGFKTYYALLNCGFRLRPTAGTASGVHPVPLGFGRVYVQLDGEFNYERWIEGLNAGRSFVTTGPMLLTTIDDKPPGSVVIRNAPGSVDVTGAAFSAQKLDRIEVIVNGDVVETITPDNKPRDEGGFESSISTQVTLNSSSWVVIRCFESHPDNRFRFAHSSPVHFDIANKPLTPRKFEMEYIITRMQAEIERNRDVLADDEVAEYERALDIYERIAKTAR